MPPVAAIAGAAGSAISGLVGANQTYKAQKGQYNQIQDIMSGLSPQVQALYASAIGNAQLGYDQAIGSLKGYGSSAKTAIGTQAAQSGAALSEDAISHGLGSSSYLMSLQHGIGLQAAKAKSGVDENVAALIGNLLKEKGLTTANLLTGQAGQTANIGTDFASILSKLQPPSHAAQFGQIGADFNALGQAGLSAWNPSGSSGFGYMNQDIHTP